MTWSLKNTTAWAFAGLFVAISALGQGLHLLPGLGHLPHLHVCSHGHRHACVASFGEAERHVGQNQVHTDQSRTGEHNCALCKFFAQGQLVSNVSSISHDFFVQYDKTLSPTVSDIRDPGSNLGARAPPAHFC